jgi:signal transduction histidine kinase
MGVMATWTRDGAVALIVLLAGLFGTAPAATVQHHQDRLGPFAYVPVVLAALVLAVRRRWPLTVLAVTSAATSLYLIAGYPYGPIQISLAVAVFTAGRCLALRPAAIACAAATVALLLHGFVGVSGVTPTGVLPFSAWTVVPFAVGVVVRVTAEANRRSRAEQIREYAFEERLRIAQEVHDVVGHGLSAINMQAEIALHLLAKRPEQAEEALTAISRTSRRPSTSCGPRWPSCAAPTRRACARPLPAWPGSTTWSGACRRRACRSRSRSPERRASFRRPSTWPPTGSCRSR